MFNKIKPLITIIDEYVQYIANFAIFISILFAGLYIALPSLQRNVELYITNRASWYMFGTYDVKKQKWKTYESDNADLDGKIKKNFYHINVEPYLGGKRGKLTLEDIRSLSNEIVVQNVNYPVMGRELESTWFGNDKKSDNEINSIAVLGDCFHIWEVIAVDNLAKPINKDSKSSTGNIWIKATKITCS